MQKVMPYKEFQGNFMSGKCFVNEGNALQRSYAERFWLFNPVIDWLRSPCGSMVRWKRHPLQAVFIDNVTDGCTKKRQAATADGGLKGVKRVPRRYLALAFTPWISNLMKRRRSNRRKMKNRTIEKEKRVSQDYKLKWKEKQYRQRELGQNAPKNAWKIAATLSHSTRPTPFGFENLRFPLCSSYFATFCVRPAMPFTI